MTTDRALELAEAALHEQRAYAKHHNQGAARELELERALDELGALREYMRTAMDLEWYENPSLLREALGDG